MKISSKLSGVTAAMHFPNRSDSKSTHPRRKIGLCDGITRSANGTRLIQQSRRLFRARLSASRLRQRKPIDCFKVPFLQKNRAKAMSMRFDGIRKLWFAPNQALAVDAARIFEGIIEVIDNQV